MASYYQGERRDGKNAQHPRTTLTASETQLTRLSFEQCIEVQPLLEVYQTRQNQDCLAELGRIVAPSASTALQGASLAVQNNCIIVRFSSEGQRLLKAGELRIAIDKAGNPLAQLVDASGKYKENARGLSGLAKAGPKLANIAAIVVSAAHIVSGADISKRLKSVDQKLNFLIAARSLEQTAHLESIFLQAREIIYLYEGEKRQEKLHDLSRLLFEGRSVWRREIQHHLSNSSVSQKSNSWLLGWFRNSSVDKKNLETSEAIFRCEAEIQMIHCSLALQLAISSAAQTDYVFIQHSLPEEIKQLDQVRRSMDELQLELEDQKSEGAKAVKLAARQMDNLVDLYGGLCASTKSLSE